MITKNELVLGAFEQLRVSGLTVNPTSSEITSAIRRMDNLIASWKNLGVCINYNFSESYSNIDLSQDSGVEESNILAVILNVAKTIAPSYGKQLSIIDLNEAKAAYDGLFDVSLTMREADTFQPTGAGNRIWGTEYYLDYQSPDEDKTSECIINDILVGETDLFATDFGGYLNESESETIASYTTEYSGGVDLISDSLSGFIINLNVSGLIAEKGQVLVTITTSLGRVLPRAVNFNVKTP